MADKDTLKDLNDYLRYSLGSAHVTSSALGGPTLNFPKQLKAMDEYKTMHDDGKDVQYDSTGHVITMTPSRASAMNEALDNVSGYIPRGMTQDDVKDLSNAKIPVLSSAANLTAMGIARDEQNNDINRYNYQTNGESLSGELSKYALDAKYYDDKVAEAKENLGSSPDARHSEMKAKLEAVEKEQADFNNREMRAIQDKQNRIARDGVFGKSLEVASSETKTSTTSGELNDLENSKDARRQSRQQARATLYQLRQNGAALNKGFAPHHEDLQQD